MVFFVSSFFDTVDRGYFVLDVTLQGGGPSIRRQDCIDRQHSEDTASTGGEDGSGTVLPSSGHYYNYYALLKCISMTYNYTHRGQGEYICDIHRAGVVYCIYMYTMMYKANH